MKRIFIVFSLLILVGVLIFKENIIKRPDGFSGEGCLFCHKEMSDSDRSHPASAFGCSICHLGNPYSLDEKRAHVTLVKNPGDLRVVEMTCGKTGCHGEIVGRVKKSLMATNRGILKIVQDEWGNGHKGARVSEKSLDVRDLYGKITPSNAPLDLYCKMCGGCHLWKEKTGDKGEVGRRGGGCSDCHVVDEEKVKNHGPLLIQHPKMTTRIPSENCVKCHNRSARIGLSYFGKFESAGYGTPYEGDDLSSRRLSGNRFYLDLPSDIHFENGKMVCIDCHTATGLMGDGHSYDKMADQVDITCEACHSPRFRSKPEAESLANRLAVLNGKIPEPKKTFIGFTRKGTPLYNLQKVNGKPVFYRKMDGQPLKLQRVSELKKAHHNLKGHERLSCQACHSAWVPQCYGCHLTYEKSAFQKDWISGKKTPGKWKETRSYLRFGKPALGVRGDGRIFPISPCQVFFSPFDDAGQYIKAESFINLNLSAFDPHTTREKSRTCIDCHADPKTIGLGEGILYRNGGKQVFRPTHQPTGSDRGSELTFPLDGFVTLAGNPLQTGSKNGVRPFDGKEIARILSVDPCVGCHSTYEDRIYQDFPKSLKRFEADQGLPCLN